MTTGSLPRDVADAMSRLRAAADAAYNGWRPQTIAQVDGSGGSRALSLVNLRVAEESWYIIPDLALAPASQPLVRIPLSVPETIDGVPLRDEPLGLIVNSLYPYTVAVDGQLVVGDEKEPTVAVGPVDTQVLDAVHAGGSATLDMRLFLPAAPKPENYLWFNFTTPSLRARFEMLDLAWARLRLAVALAATDADREAVHRAAQLVPADLDGTANTLAPALERVYDAVASIVARAEHISVHCIGHSHTDLSYLWTWEETARIYHRDLPTFVQMMDDYPEMRMTASQPVGYDVVRERDPAAFARVRELVQQGRWEAATAQWVETDTNQIAGESMTRQFTEAVWWSREHLGRSPEVVLAPDTFGHAGNIPQLAASVGARYYYHHRANPGERVSGDMWPAYWWEGDDGTRIVGVSTPHYGGSITAGKIAESVSRFALPYGHETAMLFYGVSNHGGGPTRASLDALRRLTGTPGLPQAACSTVASYGREVTEGPGRIPVHRGESPRLFEGCYSTRPDAKQRNRDAENALLTAEALATTAGIDAQDGLDEGWRRTMFHQFHDIIAGTVVNDAFDKHINDCNVAMTIAEDVTGRALTALAGVAAAGAVAVTNPLGFDREDVVVVDGSAIAGDGPVLLEGDNGHRSWGQPTTDGTLAFLASVPAFATVTYTVTAADTAPPSMVTDWPHALFDLYPSARIEADRYVRVETDHFVVVVRRDSGIVCSLRDRRSGRELVGFGMRRGSDYFDTARPELALGVYQLLEEDGTRHVAMSGWRLDEVRRETTLLSGATVEVVEDGPVRCVLRWTQRVLEGSSVTTTMTLHRALPRIDYHAAIDWHEHATAETIPTLKVSFCAELDAAVAHFETPYANVQRPAAGLEVPALRWAACAGTGAGFAVLNDGRSGHDALGSRLRLTLVHAASAPDPESGIGTHETRFALLPIAGQLDPAEVTRAAASFNQPLLATTDAGGDGSVDALRPTLGGDTTAVISAFKRARDGGGAVLRLAETAGVSTRARVFGLAGTRAVWDCDLTERRRAQLTVERGSVTVDLGPYEVRTLLLERP